MRVRTISAFALLLGLAVVWTLSEERTETRVSGGAAPESGGPTLATRDAPVARRPPKGATGSADPSPEATSAAAPQRALSATAKGWLRRINRTRTRADLGAVLESLDAEGPETLLGVLREIYPRISNLNRRLSLLAFFGSEAGDRRVHAQAVAILDLGVRDGLLCVQTRAFELLGDLVFQDFSEDREAYERWKQANGAKTVGEVICAGAADLFEGASTMDIPRLVLSAR